MELPKNAVKKLLKKNRIKRASESAIIEINKEINEKIKKITQKAKELSKHAKRKTIIKEDITLAINTTEKNAEVKS